MRIRISTSQIDTLRAGLRLVGRALLEPPCLSCHESLASEEAILCDRCRRSLSMTGDDGCSCCGDELARTTKNAGGLCPRCRDRPPSFLKLRAAVRYGRVSKVLVHSLKFHHRLDVAPLLAEYMTAAWYRFFAEEGIDALVPVPLHPWRQWWRGFNQAEELARLLGAAVHVPVILAALERPKMTPQQARLNAKARAKRQRGAFGVARDDAIAGKSLLLVDDVATTGTTAREASSALLASGARTVFVLTFARAVA